LSEDCIAAARGTTLSPNPLGREDLGKAKALNLHRIRSLNPDICLADPLQNRESDLHDLATTHRVLELPALSVPASKAALLRLGKTLDLEEPAQALVLAIQAQELAIQADLEELPPLKLALFLSHEPWLAAGAQSYEHSLLTTCGITNIYAHIPQTLAPVDAEDLRTRDPEGLLLASPPFTTVDRELLEADFFLAPRPLAFLPNRNLTDRLAHTATALQETHNLLMALRKNIGKA
jgi:ABC-type Fe3+-hydroxamate transport system substrate-binding protein